MNSKKKGNRAELEVVHILNEFYGTQEFERVPSSGARATTSKQLTEHKADIMIADVIVPKTFPFFIETKFYQDTPDLWKVFETGEFPKEWEAERTKQQEQMKVTDKRGILLVFRVNKRDWLVMVERDVWDRFHNAVPTIMYIPNDRVVMKFKSFLNSIIFAGEIK